MSALWSASMHLLSSLQFTSLCLCLSEVSLQTLCLLFEMREVSL